MAGAELETVRVDSSFCGRFAITESGGINGPVVVDGGKNVFVCFVLIFLLFCF